MSEYVTVTEAATILGVNRRTVLRLITQGRLKAITIPLDSRTKLVKREDVERVARLTTERPAPGSNLQSWPSTVGASDLGIASDDVDEWLEANWRPG